MALNFSEKKKETFILLAIVVFILSLIAWFYFDTLRLTPKTEETQTTVQKETKAAPLPAKIVHKKIDAPQTDQESPPEIPDEKESVSEPSETDPGDKQEDKTVAETTADDPDDASSSDTSEPTDAPDDETADLPDADTQTDKPSDSGDAAEHATALPEENSEVAQTADKAPEKAEEETSENKDLQETDKEKKSPKDETPVTPDMSELTASSYRMRQPLHPYSIKISSNRIKSSAQKGVKVFKNDKTDPYLVKLDLGTERGIWWNVYTGHYKTRKDALDVLKTLDRPDARIKKMSYANLIDEFSSEEEVAAVYQRLEKQGYEPYVIPDSGKWRLFVGDFLDVQGAAERNQAHLEAAGFASQIVKR